MPEACLGREQAAVHRYAIALLFFAVVWLLALILFPSSRRFVLWASVACGVAGPISEYWHARDYWTPDYFAPIVIGTWRFGVEDYVFGFLFGGICAGLFDARLARLGEGNAQGWSLGRGAALIAALLATGSALMALLTGPLKLNSLHACAAIFVVGALIVLCIRPRWTRAALESLLFGALLMWVFYWVFFLRLFPDVLADWWRPAALSGVACAGVPIEEPLWAGAGAFFAGPVLRCLLYCGGQRAAPRDPAVSP
ncbi:MAG: lycopene cyclase domain-containing protein [Candidatus Sumerlaeota bacterium]|nr:lycopene cyclase domain-containing protein [Candidatus Sumerlaeota bacterium]